MPTYSYRAIGENGKELQGSIEAPNLDVARQALEAQHVEVIEVMEAMRLRRSEAREGPTPSSATSYAFEATDKSGTVRKGSVQAVSKRAAFERIAAQGLTVTQLTPHGLQPVAANSDPDVLAWQQRQTTTTAVSPQIAPPPPQASAAIPVQQKSYLPLVTTLRLYAAWLLAWYAVFIAIGYYVHTRELSWDIPFVEGFFVSPLAMTVVKGLFLFLLITGMQKTLKSSAITTALLAMAGVGAFLAIG